MDSEREVVNGTNENYPLLLEEQSQTLKKDHESKEKAIKPKRFATISILSLVVLLLGLVQTFPLAILLPDSLKIGLTTTQAELIIAAWPASSLLSSLLQPLLNSIPTPIYLVITGMLCSLGFTSFYLSSQLTGTSYLTLAVTSRFISGTTLFLLNNKAGVVITRQLGGDVIMSSFVWEVFSSAGQAAGAYVGSCVRGQVSFPETMVCPGVLVVVAVVVLLLVCCAGVDQRTINGEIITKSHKTKQSPTHHQMAESPANHPAEPLINHQEAESPTRKQTTSPPLHTALPPSTRDLYLLHITPQMLVFLWCPLTLTGATMVFVEGNLTHFYSSLYARSLQFGGMLLGVSGVVYCVAAGVLGALRTRWSIMTIVGLVGGMFGVSVSLIGLGPVIHVVQPVYLSAVSFNLLLVWSAAIQLNAMTVAANCVKRQVSSETAMSVVMNAMNLAYNIGAFVGPVIGGFLLLTDMDYRGVFACGAPFFVVSGVIVGVHAYQQCKQGLVIY